MDKHIYRQKRITINRSIKVGTKNKKIFGFFLYLILVNSSSSSGLQPWEQPEKANISISYLRCRTRKGPFSLRILTTRLPNSSIWGVNLSPLKFTRHLSFWTSTGSPLLASRVSVLFRCKTLCFFTSGRICVQIYFLVWRINKRRYKKQS